MRHTLSFFLAYPRPSEKLGDGGHLRPQQSVPIISRRRAKNPIAANESFSPSFPVVPSLPTLLSLVLLDKAQTARGRLFLLYELCCFFPFQSGNVTLRCRHENPCNPKIMPLYVWFRFNWEVLFQKGHQKVQRDTRQVIVVYKMVRIDRMKQ